MACGGHFEKEEEFHCTPAAESRTHAYEEIFTSPDLSFCEILTDISKQLPRVQVPTSGLPHGAYWPQASPASLLQLRHHHDDFPAHATTDWLAERTGRREKWRQRKAKKKNWGKGKKGRVQEEKYRWERRKEERQEEVEEGEPAMKKQGGLPSSVSRRQSQKHTRKIFGFWRKLKEGVAVHWLVPASSLCLTAAGRCLSCCLWLEAHCESVKSEMGLD